MYIVYPHIISTMYVYIYTERESERFLYYMLCLRLVNIYKSYRNIVVLYDQNTCVWEKDTFNIKLFSFSTRMDLVWLIVYTYSITYSIYSLYNGRERIVLQTVK